MPAPDPIAQLLAGQYPDPETGALLGCEAQAIVIEDSLAGRERELVASLALGDRFAVLSDVDTHPVLGQRVERALASHFAVQSIVLPRRPHCDVETVEAIVAGLAPGLDAIIAVGSGTLNDLSKLAAQRRGLPQLVFATAPSMNGYTSVSASVAEAGVKRSVRTRTPVAAFLDLGVLAAAPTRLIRAGLGDSVCRPTAQADWLLAHLLLDQPYRAVPFTLLADEEPIVFGESAALVAGDRAAIRALARTLVLSGFGMTLCGGSYPASQGEHLISHYLEMMRPAAMLEAFHGEQVGVAAIAMAGIQTAMLARDEPPRMHATTLTRDDVVAHFGPERGDACWREVAAKQVDPAILNARLDERWPQIRARLAEVVTTPEAITAILAAAGAATTPTQLGYPDELVAAAIAHARELRERYTFLDLAADSV